MKKKKTPAEINQEEIAAFFGGMGFSKENLRNRVKEMITSRQLYQFLEGKKITLDCGHKYQVHPLSNTMIITKDGKTSCHS